MTFTAVLTVIVLILLSAVVMSFAVTTPLKFSICCETPARFGAGYENVFITTADGRKLAGWYIPPQNGAVIILLHSYYADRRQTLPIAEMLYGNGFGMLMYDQRASGESEGDSRSLGWRDIPDLGAAASWLAARQQNITIGAFGCSVGGAIALAGAGGQPSIRAVAVDAPSPLEVYENLPEFNFRDPFRLPIMALYYPLVMLRSQAAPPTSTINAVKSYGARPILFISSGQGEEYTRVGAYFNSALGPKWHWNIPEGSHCSGPVTRPLEYQNELVNFFNSTLR
jgi:uncharacterized protein